ncbi:MFS transporter [Nocardia goodfellowii]|uniref:MFS family permease n=1 Tax=Nocardia goodfellowii TaxID=882446 RepID=A0ABS4QNK1_9NOCA|nr:MFS transporter [Nocardia goodfellowii]MBP2193291.1 MFS family permease [Nocardia goodfellowii]
MANPYLALFKAPGAVAFSAAGFIARIPLAMAAIGIITMVSQMRGEYALAGAVSATFTVSTAIAGPQVSRLVDRLGQGRVLLPAMGLSVLGWAALLLSVRTDAPTWTLFAAAVIAGTLPNMAAMVRARWTYVHAGTSRMHTAFSLESVVDELTFVAGPALAVVLSTALFPEAGPLLAVVLLVVGVLLFVPQKRTEPPVRQDVSTEDRGSAIRIPAVRMLALLLASGGVIVGTVDVVSVAFAEQVGAPASAGIVVAAYAAGSGLSGLAFGTLRLSIPLPRLLVLVVSGTMLTTLPLLLVDGIAALAAAMFVSGAFFAPTMIVTMGLVERTVPVAALTEGMTWALTGLSAGIAFGALVSGTVVDRAGQAGFAVAVAAGTVALLVALLAKAPLTGAVREEIEVERSDYGRPQAQG